MTQVTFYNKLGTQNSVVVCVCDVDGDTDINKLDKAMKLSVNWNKGERRENMIVNFIGVNGLIRATGGRFS